MNLPSARRMAKRKPKNPKTKIKDHQAHQKMRTFYKVKLMNSMSILSTKNKKKVSQEVLSRLLLVWRVFTGGFKMVLSLVNQKHCKLKFYSPQFLRKVRSRLVDRIRLEVES